MTALVNPEVSLRPSGAFKFSASTSSQNITFITTSTLHKATNFTSIPSPMKRSKKPNKPTSTTKPKNTIIKNNNTTTVPDIEDFFSEKETHQMRTSLLHWYDHNYRDLPWRVPPKNEEKRNNLYEDNEKRNNLYEEAREKRAYGVWVSEVMLQQTRVQTVIDYYNKWMMKWPTIHHLSKASLEEVNEMWAGLGYYRRARFLLEGAKMIVAEGGRFPNKVSSLRKVPGIGDYTAGAIASIAFNEVVPVVDGNVIRVLARLKAISANPKDSATVKRFWKLAAQLVDPSRPGDLNQSLMELGATICTPLNPKCSSCPITSQCRALSISKQDKSSMVTDYPTKVVKLKQRHEFSAVCVVEILKSKDSGEGHHSSSEFLFVKRPDEGLLAGLWEFPAVKLGQEADLVTRRKEIDHFLEKTFQLKLQKTCSIVLREDIGEFIHIFSHIRLKVYVELLIIRIEGDMKDICCNEETISWKCVNEKAVSTLGLTSGVKKVYTMVQKFKQSRLSTDSFSTRKKNKLKKLRCS